MSKGYRLLLAVLIAMAGSIGAQAEETKGGVTDPIGVIEIKNGEPINIGVYQTISGPDTALGVDQVRGIELAFAEVKNTLLGHPVLLHVEDEQCNSEGGQTAAIKLASNPALVVALGPSCSSAADAGAPILWKAGIVSIGTSCTAPRLTDANRPPELAGFLRTTYNDNDLGSKAAAYAFNVLGKRSAATIHDGGVYTEGLSEVFEREFKALGGSISSREAVSPSDTDMRPVLTKISADAPELIFFPVFPKQAGPIIRQGAGIAGLEKITFLGSDAALVADTMVAAGKTIVGFRFAGSTFDPSELGEGYPAFVKRYEKVYGEAPIGSNHHYAYDAAKVAITAIEKVAVTDDGGNTYIGRQALRDALFATKEFEGLGGTLTCNKTGDCGKFAFAVYEFVDDDPSSFDIGTNPKQVYP